LRRLPTDEVRGDGVGAEDMLSGGILPKSPDGHTIFKKLDPTSNSTDGKKCSGEQPGLSTRQTRYQNYTATVHVGIREQLTRLTKTFMS
jgi:hypothetical protein